VIVCYPGLQPLDVTGPHEVFAGANEYLDAAGRSAPRSELILATSTPGPVVSESGLAVVAPDPLPRTGAIDTLVIPGGNGVYAARDDEALMSAVASAASRSRRVAPVCSGTFLAAAAGLLDGRHVTTHWARAKRLASEYPDL